MTTDAAADNREQVRRVLDLARDGLAPFVKRTDDSRPPVRAMIRQAMDVLWPSIVALGTNA